MRAQARWALRKLKWNPNIVVACNLEDYLSGWPPGILRVFYGTDDFVAGAELLGLSKRLLKAREDQQLRTADLTIAVSQLLVDRWSNVASRIILIPNGVVLASYANLDNVLPATDIDLPRPIVGVVGHLSSRIDIDLLEAVVNAGYSLLLVGPKDPAWEPDRFNALLESHRVAWTGPRRFEQLPGYLRLVDVGITPYADSDFNRASFPLKTLEYLAAGVPVVSTDLPATRWLNTDLIRVGTDAASFVAAVRQAANETDLNMVQQRRNFASQHSWEGRSAEFARAMGLKLDCC
jgi:teichuronic acid biosynthesis glycosyltransferase TuaH